MAELTREIALRIALTARVLPDVSVSDLLAILHGRVGSPLDDEKLKAITVENLKVALLGDEENEDAKFGLEIIKLAVRYLWGVEQADEDLPKVEAYTDGDLQDSIRVAVASDSGSLINGHFGSCLRFLVYQLSAQKSRLIDIRSTLDADSSDDKNLFRVQLIKDCHILFVQSIGGPAAAKVIRADIYPVKVPEAIAVDEKFKELQAVFNAPPPWLAKISGHSAEQRIRFAYEETA